MTETNSTPRRKWPQDLAGQRFGKLVVIERHYRPNQTLWKCQCDCGGTANKSVKNLVLGRATNCGCERLLDYKNRATKHGMSRTPIYNCWWGITYRGQNKSKEPCYASGDMHVCKRWRESFEAFYEDMGDKPSPKHSIDRLLNEKGYVCGKCEECISRGDTANCRWATKQEQSINRSCTHFITHNGETHTLIEWSRITGLPNTTIANRLLRGWSEHDALTKPSGRNGGNAKRIALVKTTSPEHNPPAVADSTAQL